MTPRISAEAIKAIRLQGGIELPLQAAEKARPPLVRHLHN
jgi:hypothetical protein